MKIAVVGSREFKDMKFARSIIMKHLIFAIPSIDDKNKVEPILISGGARGIDKLAEQEAISLKMKTKIFNPDWDKYGKSAGFIRNRDIIYSADMVLAFWDGSSKGTKHSIDLAIKAGKPLNIYVRK